MQVIAIGVALKVALAKSIERCPAEVPLQDEFLITKYVGTWYEQAKDVDASAFEKGECQQARYSASLPIRGGPKVPGNIYKVLNTEYLRDQDKISTIEGTITCDAVERAKC